MVLQTTLSCIVCVFLGSLVRGSICLDACIWGNAVVTSAPMDAQCDNCIPTQTQPTVASPTAIGGATDPDSQSLKLFTYVHVVSSRQKEMERVLWCRSWECCAVSKQVDAAVQSQHR